MPNEMIGDLVSLGETVLCSLKDFSNCMNNELNGIEGHNFDTIYGREDIKIQQDSYIEAINDCSVKHQNLDTFAQSAKMQPSFSAKRFDPFPKQNDQLVDLCHLWKAELEKSKIYNKKEVERAVDGLRLWATTPPAEGIAPLASPPLWRATRTVPSPPGAQIKPDKLLCEKICVNEGDVTENIY